MNIVFFDHLWIVINTKINRMGKGKIIGLKFSPFSFKLNKLMILSIRGMNSANILTKIGNNFFMVV